MDGPRKNRGSAAEALQKHRNLVLRLWEERARLALPAVHDVNSLVLRNSLPLFLDDLIHALGSAKELSDTASYRAKEHGRKRSKLEAYDLAEVIEEYQILRRVILEVLRKEESVSEEETDAILDWIGSAVREAAAEFKLQRDRQNQCAEESLERSQENLRITLEGIKDYAIIRTDLEGRITDWTAGGKKIFGYEEAEVMGRSASLIFTAEDIARGAPEQEMRCARNTGRAEDNRWHVRKDGSRFFASGVMNSLRDESGNMFGYIKVLRDNTQQKMLERHLLEQGRKLDEEMLKFGKIFTHSPAAMALWRGGDFVFEKVNPRYQQIFAGRELVGKPFHEALPEFENQPFLALIKSVFETGEPFVGVEMPARHARHPGGPLENFYYDFTYARLEDAEGQPYGVFDHAVDVTERVAARLRSEEDRLTLERTVTELEQERELRDRFTSALAHDLRNPLTSAKMSVQIALRYRDSVEARERHLHKSIEALNRTDRMITDLLDASRLKGGQKLPLKVVACDFARILHDTLDELETIHGERFEREIPESVPGSWSREGIRRVMENLLTNAVKYGAADVPIKASLRPQGDWVVFEVHNYGDPIKPAEQGKLFNLFQRMESAQRSNQKGWGIGLTLVKGIVESHGGNVSATSSVEDGTRFTVVLLRNTADDEGGSAV